MSRSNSSCEILILISTALVLAVSATPLASSQAFSQQNPAKLVHDLLIVAYPDFPPKDFLRISFEENVSASWRQFFGVWYKVVPLSKDEEANAVDSITLDRHTGKRLPPPDNAPVLSGTIHFASGRHILDFSATGPLVNSPQNETLKRLVEAHPDWTNEMDYDALKNAGALFGPSDKQALLESIHLEKYEPFLGHMKVRSVEFQGSLEPHIGSFCLMSWLVTVDAHPHRGEMWTYYLDFEPFGGRLTDLYRSDALLPRPTGK